LHVLIVPLFRGARRQAAETQAEETQAEETQAEETQVAEQKQVAERRGSRIMEVGSGTSISYFSPIGKGSESEKRGLYRGEGWAGEGLSPLFAKRGFVAEVVPSWEFEQAERGSLLTPLLPKSPSIKSPLTPP
jgi:hypothetical protein